MGLDMYLTRKVYIGQRYEHRKIEGVIDIRTDVVGAGEPPIPLATSIENLANIEYDVKYWRKDNAIHNWFVKNVQEGSDDCGTYWVSPAKLGELLEVCRNVIRILDQERKRLDDLNATSEEENSGRVVEAEEEDDAGITFDPVLVENLLPPVSGFFYGGTAIDEWYIQGVKETIEVLSDELESEDIRDERGDYYYTSSW